MQKTQDMNIYLVRHGEQNNNGCYKPDAELTPDGIKQANLLGWRLQNAGVIRIYTSDLPGAEQTAETINRHLHREVIHMPEFREISFGEWEGLSYSEVESRYTGFLQEFSQHQRDMPYPGGESGEDVKNRTLASLEQIALSNHDSVIISHGGVILTLLCALMGFSLEKRFQLCQPEFCSICRVSYNPLKGYSILSINDTAHLA